MSSTPKFSVVIPAFNAARTLPNAINSIVHQTYKDWELILVDDGSTDDTFRVVQKFNDSRIHYYRQQHKEIVATRNLGFDFAKAEWIVIQDADDMSLPDRLEKLVPYTEDYDVIVHGLYFNIWDQAVECMCRTYVPPKAEGDLLLAQTIPGVCAFRKSIWEKHPLREETKYCFDWMMHLDWTLSGYRYHFLDLGLYEYVRMQNSASIFFEKSGKREQSINNIREIVKREYGKNVGTGVIPNRLGLPRA